MSDSDTYKIHILPEDITIRVDSEANLLETLQTEGIFLRADCSGIGRCGKCQVFVSRTTGEVEQEHTKLSCREKITTDLTITIPDRSRYKFELFEKSIDDLRLQQNLAKNTLSARHIETGYAIAVDLGTTTIGVYLCDLSTNRVCLSSAIRNPQVILGLDVISRISAINCDPDKLSILQRMVVRAVEQITQSLFHSARISIRQLNAMVVVGNPTMIHILQGVNPSSIGYAPYSPSFTEARDIPARQLGFTFPESVKVQSPPLLSGFLGSDILAAALAVDFVEQAEGTLLIDMGTNGEVMLKTKDGAIATSCATGPAFEGSNITCGMPAMSGAICDVRLRNNGTKLETKVISRNGNQVAPEGICGSGLVSAIAEFLRTGIIVPSGAFNPSCELASLRRDKVPAEFVIADKTQTQTDIALTITQKDIRSVQLAKGALSAGITMLCQHAGFDRPHRIYLAGAFGNFLNISDCLAIGLFGDFDNENKIDIVGNSAGTGAVQLLLDNNARQTVEQLFQLTDVITAADWSNFQTCFVDSINFPDC